MAQDFMTYSMPLEVFFDTAIVRGVLVTNQDRLSNHLLLREGEEGFSLRDAKLTDLADNVLSDSNQFVVYMRQAALIADLSPQLRQSRAGLEHLYVKKDPSRAVLGVGRYWIEGNVHLTPGANVQEILMARTRFVPVTEAVFLDKRDAPLRTFLVNRNLINCISVSS